MLFLILYLSILVVVFSDASKSIKPSTPSDLFIMPWMCLERCGDNSADITAEIAQFQVNRSSFTDVSFELFNLGPNSTLIVNNLTRVSNQLNALGLGTWPMISSYPYPPEFLTWMRQVFATPQPFFDSVISSAKKIGATGLNIDWEPTSAGPKVTKQDPIDYANFLDQLAVQAHLNGLKVSVDVATWSDIWDLKLIGATRVDYIANMETYVKNNTVWLQELAASLELLPVDKLVVGLECDVDLTDNDIALRLNALLAAKIKQIGIWKSPIPDSWWNLLDAFTKQ
jgi:hypothetical protein